MTKQYLDEEWIPFLNKQGWTFDGSHWKSPNMELDSRSIGFIFSMNRGLRGDLTTYDQVVEQLSHPGADQQDAKNTLTRFYPDQNDYTRWFFEVSDRTPYVWFILNDEEEIREVSGLGEKAEEYGRLWNSVENAEKVILSSTGNILEQFEIAMRNLWKIYTDDGLRTAANWGDRHWTTIFDEEQVQNIVNNPVVYLRIDLRNSNRVQRDRLKTALEIDAQFPERHILLDEHITGYTQIHAKELRALTRKVEKGEIEKEEADEEFSKIMEKPEEVKKEPELDSYWNETEVFVNNFKPNQRVFVLPESMEDDIKSKLLARMSTRRVNFIIYPNQGKMLVSTKDGIDGDNPITYSGGNDPDLLELLERRGFVINYQ